MTDTPKYKKLPAFTSPKAPFRYPKLAEPDYGNEKYAKPDGEYSVQIILQADSPEAKALIKQLTPIYEEAKAEAAQRFKDLSVKVRKDFQAKGVTGPVMNPMFGTLYDKETEEETGEISFKASMKASGKNKKTGKAWTRKPTIFDARGNRMAKVPDIWGGTVGKVAFEVSTYFVEGSAAAGIKLNLTGAQVIDLVKGGERSASDLGFEEEDGYEHDDSTVAGPAFDATDESPDAAAGNF